MTVPSRMLDRHTITEFLLARIAEDEEGGRYALRFADGGPGVRQEWAWLERYWRGGRKMPPSTHHHEGAPSPARVLAECEAKRRIVELHQPDRDFPCCAACHLSTDRDGEYGPCRTARMLALPYDSHADYQQEWKP